MALDRSTGATIARTGGRLVVVLLPLAALAVVRAFPGALGTPLPWLAPGFAAVAAGAALVAAVAAAMSHGRLRGFADAAALAILAATFAVAAIGTTAAAGVSAGLVAAAAALGLGSIAADRVVPIGRVRILLGAATFLAAEACLGLVLLAAQADDGPVAQTVAVAAAVLLALAAVVSFREPARATAIGLASASALVFALAGPAATERLVGVAGVAAAAVLLGWSIVVSQLLRGRDDLTARAVVATRLEGMPGPEFDEGARLARELRATIDDLVVARRTIELQRAEIERATTLDPLTGTSGRAALLERLRMEAAEGRRYAHPVALMLLDVDRFAEINHAHGLAVGDAILREVALRLRLRIREADALGRVGGDAFAAILPHTDEVGAASFARAVLDRLEERRFPTDSGELTVTASVGIALLRPGIPMSDEELLAAAEEALASAKTAGGNRIAFDRLHNLARLGERGRDASTGDPAEGRQQGDGRA